MFDIGNPISGIHLRSNCLLIYTVIASRTTIRKVITNFELMRTYFAHRLHFPDKNQKKILLKIRERLGIGDFRSEGGVFNFPESG